MFAIKSAVRMRVGLLVGMAMIAAPQLEAIVVNSSYTLAEAAAR